MATSGTTPLAHGHRPPENSALPVPYKDLARRRALGGRADLPAENLAGLIEYTRDSDPHVRQWAVNEMCPCDSRTPVAPVA